MEAQVVTIAQPFHAAYEKCIEITSPRSGEMSCDKTHSAMEASLETEGRELRRLLRQEHLDTQGGVWVGEAVCGSDGVVRSPTRAHMASGSKRVCGAMRVARTGESQRGVASLCPREAPLTLPAHGDAHRLQKRVATQAVTSSFEGVVNDIATETSVRLGKRQVEPVVYAAAQDFDALYAQGCAEEVQQQAHAQPIQGLTFDGEGVVRRPEALREATRKKAEASAQRPPRGFARQEKSNRKRMATVAGISHVDRHRRSPQTVARQFAPLRLVPSTGNPAPKPVGKQRWASLEKPMKTVMETGCAAGLRRDPEHQAEWVVWVDGEHTQSACIEKAANASGVTVAIMVASMHVLAYLWKAANALCEPEDANAAQGVGEKIEQRLQGQGHSIVRS
jgi:hypothetical protein